MPYSELHYGETPPLASNWGRTLTNIQIGTEALIPTTRKELHPANNHVSLEVDSFPIMPSNETPALANALTAASWDILEQKTQLSHAWILDPHKHRDNKYVLL